MDSRLLLLPLAELPGPVPAGAPVRACCRVCKGTGMVPWAAQNSRGEIVPGPCSVCPPVSFLLYIADLDASHTVPARREW